MPKDSSSDLVYWIWLNELRGIPLRTKRTLLTLLGNPKQVFSATYDDITEVLVNHCKQFTSVTKSHHHLPRFAPLWSERNLKQAESILQLHQQHHIHTLCAHDNPYHHRYTQDQKAPLVLYYRGKLSTPDIPIYGIIGSRSCTSYGRTITKEAVREALGRNEIIASGLSFGIDAIAHEATLSHSGITYAFLPCGLHTVQPAAHAQLMEKICDTGAVITQFTYGKEALPFRFIQRNNLLASWCDTLLVVEASIHSPCIHTARTALAKDTQVLAVPNSLLEPKSQGTNYLLSEGAHIYLNDTLLDTPPMHPQAKKIEQPQGQNIMRVLHEKPLGTGELASLVGQNTTIIMESLASMEMAEQVEYRSDGKWHRVGGP